jgi:FKBP-type peptidyl-prolyl cis-trans isomerase FkpA
VVAGSGDEARAGQNVSVHYTGWLTTGQKFDSSRDRGQPFTFRLGGGQVIQGWDEGVAGMHVGGQRRLIIPPNNSWRLRWVGFERHRDPVIDRRIHTTWAMDHVPTAMGIPRGGHFFPGTSPARCLPDASPPNALHYESALIAR